MTLCCRASSTWHLESTYFLQWLVPEDECNMILQNICNLVQQASHSRRPRNLPLLILYFTTWTHTKDHSMTATWQMSINHSQLHASTRCSVLFTFTVSTAFRKITQTVIQFVVPYVQDATQTCGTRVSLVYAQKHKKIHQSRKATWTYSRYRLWFSEHMWLTSSFLCSQKTVASSRRTQ